MILPGDHAAWLETVVDTAEVNRWLAYAVIDRRERALRTLKGWPDLTLVREQIVYVELKTGQARLRRGQIEVARRLMVAGGRVYLWHPEMWDAITAFLETGRNGPGELGRTPGWLLEVSIDATE